MASGETQRMRCHYEVLGLPRDCDDTELKKAYRKLALKYHPDKNPDRVDECAQLFREVQQAYDVLSDPQERAWYDKHRDAILRGVGSGYKDDSIDLMPFFSASCFSGYGDDSKGFYAVYGMVFGKIMSEDRQYKGDSSDEEAPLFGGSRSSYDDVLSFYGYWQSYCSQKTFEWEDKYDLRGAPNRRVQRAMEKENKKARDSAKKERNEIVRQLVAFVRKRDKRMQAYKDLLKQKEVDRQKLVAEKRMAELQRRQQERESYKEQEWQSMSTLETEIKDMEARLDCEFGKESDDEDEVDVDEESLDLFCAACNKLFKTAKAKSNHEKSKKHKENVVLLKQIIQNDEEKLQTSTSSRTTQDPTNTGPNITKDKANLSLHENELCGDVLSETTDGGIIEGDQDTGNEEDSLESGGVDINEANHIKDTSLVDSVDNGRPDAITDVDKTAADELLASSSSSDEVEKQFLLLANSKKNKKKGTGVPRSSNSLQSGIPGEQSVGGGSAKRQDQQLSSLGDQQLTADHIPASVSPSDSQQVATRPSKHKRKKKAASTNPSSTQPSSNQAAPLALLCHKCHREFPSRNKLFQHIKETGHAQVHLTNQTSIGGGKKKTRTKQ